MDVLNAPMKCDLCGKRIKEAYRHWIDQKKTYVDLCAACNNTDWKPKAIDLKS